MKQILGIVLIIGGGFLALYIGGWVFFVGGIVDVIEQIRAPELEAVAVAVGIAKVIFAGFTGVAIFVVSLLIGLFLFND